MPTACGSRGWRWCTCTDLVAESLTDAGGAAADLIRQFLEEAGVKDDRTRGEPGGLSLGALPDKEMVSAMMAGVRKSAAPRQTGARLGDYLSAAGG